MYTNIGPAPNNLAYASTILACLAICVTVPIYIFYFYGPRIRARSKFAQEISSERAQHSGARRASMRPRPEDV